MLYASICLNSRNSVRRLDNRLYFYSTAGLVIGSFRGIITDLLVQSPMALDLLGAQQTIRVPGRLSVRSQPSLRILRGKLPDTDRVSLQLEPLPIGLRQRE